MADPVEAQEDIEDELERAGEAIGLAVMAVLARRLGKVKAGEYAAAYAAMNVDMAEIERITERGRRKLQSIADDAMDDMGKGNDAWARPYYSARKIEQVAVSDHPTLAAKLAQGKKEARAAISSLVDTSVFGLAGKRPDGSMVVQRIRPAYLSAITDATAAMAAGEQAYTQAISQAVKTLADGGLRVIYPSTYEKKVLDATGRFVVATETATRAKPLTRELYGAVRMNVMGTYRATMADIRQAQGKEFGADGVEISAHVPSAEDHEPYQGRRYPTRVWNLLQGSLARPIETGYNCRHTVSPVIMGIGKQAYTNAELKAMRKRSSGDVTFRGLRDELTMSRYDASQYVRGVERSLRSANNAAYLMEQAGQDASAAKAIVKAKTGEYTRICKAVGITPQMDRTRAYVV